MTGIKRSDDIRGTSFKGVARLGVVKRGVAWRGTASQPALPSGVIMLGGAPLQIAGSKITFNP